MLFGQLLASEMLCQDNMAFGSTCTHARNRPMLTGQVLDRTSANDKVLHQTIF